MATDIFVGRPSQKVAKWIIDHYLPQSHNDKLELVVQTTGSYMKTGIYESTRNDASKPITIDWGDGTIEQVDGDISQKVHEYSSEGTFNVVVKNIKTYAASANDYEWHETTSQNAYTLKEVVAIPDSVQTISDLAFYNCTSMSSVTIPDSVQTIGDAAFAYCTSLTSVTIPDSVQAISSHAFRSCTSLTSIIIPDSVQTINYYTFYNCTSLSSITISDGVTTIGVDAFSNCTSLASVTIPDSVQMIGNDAFYGCTSVTDVYCYPDPADLAWDENGCDDFKDDAQTICHVKAEYLEAYQSKFTGVVNVTFAGDLA